MYGRVTEAMPWILRKIQPGECVAIRNEMNRRAEKNKKSKNQKR